MAVNFDDAYIREQLDQGEFQVFVGVNRLELDSSSRLAIHGSSLGWMRKA